MRWLSVLATATFVVALADPAQAGTAGLTGTGAFSGTFTMYDPTGAVAGGSGAVGELIPGGNTSYLGDPFFSYYAHDGTMVDNGDGTYTSHLLLDLGATRDLPMVVVWEVDDEILGGAVTSLDGDGDGISGVAMTAGPFAGFSPFFAGTQSGLTVLPEPLSMALVATTLTGLVGLRRKLLA